MRCPKLEMMNRPQQLSSNALAEFKAAYEEEFNEPLSDNEAREMALRLLRFFGILAESKRENSAESPASN